jgi:zinc-binding alcohol dehydrogenase family protein
MKAVAFKRSRPITDPEALEDIELDVPLPRHHDLLVEVRAVSVNPVDTKLRQTDDPLNEPRVLGFDAAGVVKAIGPEVLNFAIGDEVFYCGAPNRPGSNAEFQLVDDRIVGHKPKTLSFAEAASLPLTALTAWEMLFERFRIPRDQPAEGTLLIVGGAGGVGSIATQLAAELTELTVVATASRPETQEWCRLLGAHHVLDHNTELAPQLLEKGLAVPDYIFCTTQARLHFRQLAELVAPEGAIGVIEPAAGPFDLAPLLRKSGALHGEYVFGRAMRHDHMMSAQHRTLEAIAHLIDSGRLKPTYTEHFGTINAANLRRAHAAIEGLHVRGKIVLEGF